MTQYSRQRPSPRYLRLVELHRQMHIETGERFRAIPPQKVFRGFSLLPHVEAIKRLIDEHGATTLLDYGSGKGRQYTSVVELGSRACTVPEAWGVEAPACYDPAYSRHSALPAGRFDGVICTDVLEHCPEEDIAWRPRLTLPGRLKRLTMRPRLPSAGTCQSIGSSAGDARERARYPTKTS